MVRNLARSTTLVGLVVLGALILVGTGAGGSRKTAALAVTSTAGTPPNSTSEVDCNGLSPKYPAVKKTMQALCTDPMTIYDGKTSRFVDNGRYIGHDEPSTKFISSAPGTGNHFTYYVQLSVDPTATPTLDGSVSDYAELSPAPWFGLPICDGNSYPQNPCTPDSDTNTGTGLATDAGSAFLELQLYPPGYQPWADGPSCDATHYCAALNIDSLACTFGFEFCNSSCEEPVNFAWIQRNGVPAGPPSPQETDAQTQTPNGETLMMNQGDSIRLTIKDTKDGLKVVIDDLSTGQSGFMVASAANGFMNTDLNTCNGTPFSFHPEYNTAQPQNQVPWAALEGGVLMEDELGHFEPCAGVSNALVDSTGAPFVAADPYTFQTCDGGTEGAGQIGEGPCNFDTGDCTNVSTEAGGTCPSSNFASGASCEFEDGICVPRGSRPVDPATMFGGVSTASWPIAGCQEDFTQNGDLDFDGSSYQKDYPDGSSNHPTPFRYAGPYDQHGQPYPQVQFETNVAASENNCDLTSGSGCTAQPQGAAFYPFWSIGKQQNPTGFPFSPEQGSPSDSATASPSTSYGNNGHKQGGNVCLWNFGNDISGTTTDDFGGVAQYGTPDLARFAGTLTSPVLPNPQLTNSCKSKGGRGH